ncbi:MAG: YgiT-type zinc finger protein [Gammaproteobacteria bacterium]|nr:YgiT-type zinc finger protein [Gammaproteobacteria bacterium]
MSNSDYLCPVCGEGNLHAHVGKNPVEYKGRATELELHFSLCDACGSEQADAGQTRTNKRLMNAFKKRADGLLTGVEVRGLRERLGLSQAEAAQIFGGGPVAFSKYETDDVVQSEAMDKLLRLAVGLPAALELLRHRAGVDRVIAGEEWHAAGNWHPAALGARSVSGPVRLISSSTPCGEQEARYAA